MDPQPAVSGRSARLRSIATYPFRLGPMELGQRIVDTPFGGLAIVHNLSSIGDSLVTVALAGSVFVSVSLHAARYRTALGRTLGCCNTSESVKKLPSDLAILPPPMRK